MRQRKYLKGEKINERRRKNARFADASKTDHLPPLRKHRTRICHTLQKRAFTSNRLFDLCDNFTLYLHYKHSSECLYSEQ